MQDRKQLNKRPLIELVDIEKHFGITRALQGASLRVFPGEVIGLIGPNGAGKSTMMKIVTGLLEPTAGDVYLDGRKLTRHSQKDAYQAGISCAYQDLSLCTNLMVYENFAMLNMDHKPFSRPGWRGRKKEETRRLLESFFPGNGINVMKPVSALSLAQQQFVEICKALMAENLKLLVLDEPTSALSTDRAEQLHEVVRQVSGRGVAVIYISHKLDEIKKVSDRVILLRNGQNGGEFDPRTTTAEELIGLMGGEARKREGDAAPSGPSGEDCLVAVENLSTGVLGGVSLVVGRGEIVGISGLAGSGQTELLHSIFYSGNSRLGGNKAITVSGSIAYVSGDRAKEGVLPLWSIMDNILLSSLDRVRNGFLMSKAKSRALAQKWYDKLMFRAEGIDTPITALSGGNQQKALIARGIASGADVVILNDPTAGVDVETKREIYGLLRETTGQGKSVILYSTEDAEMEICDRAYVMHEGCITEELAGAEITVPNIVKASFKKVKKRQAAGTEKASPFSAILQSRMLLPVLTLLVMFAVNAWVNPKVLSYNSVRMLLSSAVPLVFAALGQMFIVVAGDIDMGNGYSIALVNVLVAVVLTQSLLVGLVCLAVFIGAYMLMGALVHLRHLPAIVVTLGAQFIWMGVGLLIAPVPGGTCPAWLNSMYRFRFSYVPMPGVISILAAALCYFILYRSKYGMILRGIGNNRSAVERSGWSYLQAKMACYGLAGLMVVFAGMAYTAVTHGADVNSSASFCMMSIATVILGGCLMSGGVVEPVGVVAAGIAMSLITSLLTFVRVGSNYQTAVMGSILILALAMKLVPKRGRGATS